MPLAAAFGAKTYILALFGRIMIFAIAAIALDLLIGYGGLISFGHAAFVGLGAYAVGILSAHGITDALIALPVALIASALFGLATGAVCLRTRGVYFIMITLGVQPDGVFHRVIARALWRRRRAHRSRRATRLRALR